MSESNVGKPLDRIDARRKVTGTATYAAEVAVANVAYAVVVGSAVACGELEAIDTTAARKAPGVFAVLTHENAPKLPTANDKSGHPDFKILQVLQDAKIFYADQPIAVVVADSLERAQHAALLVQPTFHAAQITSCQLAKGGEEYKPAHAGNRGPTDTSRGDFDAAFARAPIKIDATYTTPVENHNPMEMHSTIAVWQGNDHLTLYDSTQGIFNVRERIASMFNLPKENVRVINHFVGGGFGSKGSPWSHVGLAALAAKVVGRPVKLVVSRIQMQSLVGHRPTTIQHVALGCDAAGKLHAIRHDVTSETSRFDEFVEVAAVHTRMLYACPNVVTTHRLVRLDVPTPTFTRAPGASSGSYALESAMDELAYAAKIDPLQLRIANHATFDAQENKPYSSKSLLECYRRGAEAFGWVRRAKAPRQMRDGRWLVGYGMATATYPARQRPASAIARLRPDGSVLVQAGTQDLGTGTYTIMTQIAADMIGVPYERVTFELGDTTFPETPLSAGSFTAASTGSAVKMAGLALRDTLVALAVADPRSPLHGVPPLALAAADGALFVRERPQTREPLHAILARTGKPELTASYSSKENQFADDYSMHSFGAAFAEVRVDEELGVVRLARFTGAYAAGKILNPKTARSQYIGGIVWGAGMALTEAGVRDARSSRIMTRDLADYHVPVNADIPNLDVIMVDEVDPYVNEVGAKGIGEIGTCGAAAAIANAVYHATGRRVRDLPITLDKLLGDSRA